MSVIWRDPPIRQGVPGVWFNVLNELISRPGQWAMIRETDDSVGALDTGECDASPTGTDSPRKPDGSPGSASAPALAEPGGESGMQDGSPAAPLAIRKDASSPGSASAPANPLRDLAVQLADLQWPKPAQARTPLGDRLHERGAK